MSYCDQIQTKAKTIYPLMLNEERRNTRCFNLKVMRTVAEKKIQKTVLKVSRLEIIFSNATIIMRKQMEIH